MTTAEYWLDQARQGKPGPGGIALDEEGKIFRAMKNICIDFDGVIHSYTTKWEHPDIIPDPPMPGAFAFIRELLANGFNVYIMSARFHRSTDFGDTPDARGPRGLEKVFEWFIQHGGADIISQVMDPKVGGKPGVCFVINKPAAVLYIDDRAFQFQGSFPTLEYIYNFRPWGLPGSANGEWK